MTTLIPKYDQGGSNAVNRPFNQKLQEIVSVLDFGADPTGTTDSLSAFNSAMATSSGASVYVPPGTYIVSAPINLSSTGTKLYGSNKVNTVISQQSSVWTGKSLTTYPATIVVNYTQCAIENLTINGGLNTNNSDCILISSGQQLALNRLNINAGNNGINFISGNLQRWYDIFAQTCNVGFVVTPDSGDNTNGCVMTAVGAYNCGAGLTITKGTGATGHSFSNWVFYAEGGHNGAYIRGGLYCNFDLYMDTLSGGTYSYDLDPSAPHRYFLKNPGNATNGAIGVGSSYAMGVNGTGGQLISDLGNAPSQINSITSSTGITLSGENITLYVVSNTNTSSQIGLSLAFLAYTSIGVTVRIIKTDSTGAAFILAAPTGITLIGNTGVFGSFATGVLEVTVISSTQAFCKQY
jgi:hypothetical protein